MIAFPRRHLAGLEELATEVLERSGLKAPPDALARDMLTGFFELCMNAGLDGVLVDVEREFAPLRIEDETDLAEEPRLRDALAERLSDRTQFHPGGPRAAVPGQLVDCVVATLTLSPSEEAERTILLADAVRREVLTALASSVDVLAVPQVRTAIISRAHALCEPRYRDALEQIAPQLDQRAVRFPPQPKMPLHAVQAVNRVLADARDEVIARAAQGAIDGAVRVLTSTSPEAAARIDQPISHRITPRDAAIRRLGRLRIPTPEAVVESLIASVSELADLAWEEAQPDARPYSPRSTFAIGDVVDHPTFGRGTVQATWETTIDVEFEDGWHALVHARSG